MRSIPRMPKSTTSTPSGSSRPASRFTTSTPKPSSPKNTLPTPATRTRLLTGVLQVQRHNLLGGEEEPMPEDAIPPEILARVVLQRDRDVDPVFVVLLYALDERGLPGERDVYNVPSGAGPEQNLASLPELDPLHDHTLEGGPPLLLPEEVHYSIPLSTRSSRMAPCRFISSSGERDSVLSRISRALGSEARISSFSSSVRERTLKTSN